MKRKPAIRFPARLLALGILLSLLPPAASGGPLPSLPKKAKAGIALPGKRTYVSNVVFVAFDTETTGFSPEKDRIVEVGAVKFKNGEVVDSRSWLVNPSRKIPYWARRVHGINDAMVRDEPTFKDIYPDFQAFIEGTVLIAHNARFDISFISEETKRNGFTSPSNEVIDSLPLFKQWFPDAESYSLESLAHRLDVDGKTFHRAMADSMYIYHLFGIGYTDHPALKTLGSLQKAAGGSLSF